MIADHQHVAQKSPAPFLVRAMIFSTSGWERRRRVGQRRFVARMTLLGIVSGAILAATTVFSSWRSGASFDDLLRGSSLVLLVVAVMTPLVLFSVASLEWRILEARYTLELAKEGRSPSRFPADALPREREV